MQQTTMDTPNPAFLVSYNICENGHEIMGHFFLVNQYCHSDAITRAFEIAREENNGERDDLDEERLLNDYLTQQVEINDVRYVSGEERVILQKFLPFVTLR